MPPKAEQLQRFEIPGERVDYFFVDMFSQEEFSADVFDKQLKSMESSFYPGKAKYVVIGDQMIIFRFMTNHDDFYRYSQAMNIQGELQSAGLVSFNLTGKPIRGPRLKFHGESYTLIKKGLLSGDKSDVYKNSVIKGAFGPHAMVE